MKIHDKCNDFVSQASEYVELSDMINRVKCSDDITADLVDKLVERISVFSDRRTDVDYRFSSGLEQFCEALAL